MDITFTKTFSPLDAPDKCDTLGIGPVCLVDGADYIGTEDENLINWTADNALVLCRQVERLRHRYIQGQFGGFIDTVDHVRGGEPVAIIFRNANSGEVYMWAEGDGLHYCLIDAGAAREITKTEAHRAYLGEDSFYAGKALNQSV